MSMSTHVSRHLRDAGIPVGNSADFSEGVKVKGSTYDRTPSIWVSFDNQSVRRRMADAIREVLEESTWSFTEKVTDPDKWGGLHSFYITGVDPDKAKAARRRRDAANRKAKRDAAKAAAAAETTPPPAAAPAPAQPQAVTNAVIRHQAEVYQRAATVAADMTPAQRDQVRTMMARHQRGSTHKTSTTRPAPTPPPGVTPVTPGRYLVTLPGRPARAVYVTDNGTVQDMVTRRILATDHGAADILDLLGTNADALAATKEFGRQYGICGRCGTILDNPKSQARGLGPDCAKALGDDT